MLWIIEAYLRKKIKNPSKSLKSICYIVSSFGIYKMFTFKVKKDEIVILNSRIQGLLKIVLRDPGIYMKIPFFMKPIHFRLKEEQFLHRFLFITKDNVKVNIVLDVTHIPDENSIVEHYRHYKYNYSEEALPSIIEDTIKQIIRDYTSLEILLDNNKIIELIHSNILSAGLKYYIRFTNISIEILDFSEEISDPTYKDLVKQSLFRFYL